MHNEVTYYLNLPKLKIAFMSKLKNKIKSVIINKTGDYEKQQVKEL